VLQQAQSSPAFQSTVEQASSRREWLFLGCGTSFYLAEAAAATWTLLTGQFARALPASERLSRCSFPILRVWLRRVCRPS